MIAGIGLCAFGTAAFVWGARYAFNLRGATDRALARGSEIRALAAARRGELGGAAAGPPPWRFRLRAGLVMAGGPPLALLGLVLALG
ncbi:hypothetical protein ACVW0K_004974 [Streptomyces filamentosus]|uniref:hypothetical protein n=1 Tax=Streptomyces filamentosus TaxID=67294 RepID=UPI0036E70711